MLYFSFAYKLPVHQSLKRLKIVNHSDESCKIGNRVAPEISDTGNFDLSAAIEDEEKSDDNVDTMLENEDCSIPGELSPTVENVGFDFKISNIKKLTPMRTISAHENLQKKWKRKKFKKVVGTEGD